jgi:hypothetical protein
VTAFDVYLKRHGHLPTIKLSRGRSVYAGNGYIAIEQAGHRIYITRSDLPKFLRFAQSMGKSMKESFDPQAAMAEALDAEEEYLREQRRAKKTRYRPRRRA